MLVSHSGTVRERSPWANVERDQWRGRFMERPRSFITPFDELLECSPRRH